VKKDLEVLAIDEIRDRVVFKRSQKVEEL